MTRIYLACAAGTLGLVYFVMSPLLISCGATADGGGCSVTSTPAGVSSAPSLVFYFGGPTESTGTALTSGNASTFQSYFTSGGCGPFGIYESGNGGEVATEIEMRINTRLGVFAMAEGVVTDIQASSSPTETGEIEGVWVRYGTNYIIKYVHVKDPTVVAGDLITAGQRLGVTPALSSPSTYFLETEVRKKDGNSIKALAWNSLLADSAAFNALFNVGNCTAGGALLGTDGTSSTTASNWKNDNLTPAEWNVTDRDNPCSFP